MKYKNVVRGRFIARPNRFVAQVEINGTVETVHVKNTGRCRELLLPDSTVYLAVSDNSARKTKYDLVGVEKKREGKPALMINMDSQAPNAAAEEWLKGGNLFSAGAVVRREVKYGKSRFDFYIEDGDRRAFLEVKGVTLENNGTAMFPDAPTERGVKHIRELTDCLRDGYEAYILFVIQMKEITLFKPNAEMHREFAEVLTDAQQAGVEIIAADCVVTENSMTLDKFVEIIL
ncbi:MAG: DNA/RNA nuclease SfsA [Ruminiclostridium sp.]|nr:DNA/RNA nuclease SfsA [Ruminiclostridium sp.]